MINKISNKQKWHVRRFRIASRLLSASHESRHLGNQLKHVYFFSQMSSHSRSHDEPQSHQNPDLTCLSLCTANSCCHPSKHPIDHVRAFPRIAIRTLQDIDSLQPCVIKLVQIPASEKRPFEHDTSELAPACIFSKVLAYGLLCSLSFPVPLQSSIPSRNFYA